MKYSLLNLRTMFLHRPYLFLLIVLSQIAAILSVYISVGLINSSLKSKQEAVFEQLEFNIDFCSTNDEKIPESAPYWKDARDKFLELYEFTDKNIESISMSGGGDNKECGLYSWISEGGNTNTVGPKNSCYASDYYNKGDVFTVLGTDYTVIDTSPTRPSIVINFDDFPDNAKIGSFNIRLNDAISQQRIKEISAKINELFPEAKSLTEPKPITLLQIQIDNMFIFTSAFILLIAVVNISVYFSFLFKKREKQNATMKICGASKWDIFLISIFEMLVSYIISLILSLIIFIAALPILKEKYQGFSLFDDKKYIAVFALTYFLVSTFVSVMISYKYSSASPAQSYKRAQKGGI